jgi:hypothetical protein
LSPSSFDFGEDFGPKTSSTRLVAFVRAQQIFGERAESSKILQFSLMLQSVLL